MKRNVIILVLLIIIHNWPNSATAQQYPASIHFDFCGVPVSFDFDRSQEPGLPVSLSKESIQLFYNTIDKKGYKQVLAALIAYKEKYKPDDWLFYQLIRQTAQHISPKADNYLRYTIYKWFLLTKCGYDAILTLSEDHVLFYVRCDENIYNIPGRIDNGKQYVCLNYHDYGNIDFDKELFYVSLIPPGEPKKVFSYKIKQLPDFNLTDYLEKDLSFSYHEYDYHFKVKLNPRIRTIFANYPVVDYELYLNIPLSRETYNSLIPLLRKNVKGMTTKNGVDYLMRFTRYAFLFETDSRNFGSEKRLSPEQTLLYEQSDCEDRVALFFYLVREIYDLPMIVLSYPKHVTIAVQFDKPVGKFISYNGNKYSVCEPTPQKQDLLLGQLLPELSNSTYEVAYVYTPKNK